MNRGAFFVGFLLVCLAQVVVCCGASAGKGSQTVKNDTTKGSSKPLDSVEPSNDTSINNIRRRKHATSTNTNITSQPQENRRSVRKNETSGHEVIKTLNTTPAVKVVTRTEAKTHVTDRGSDVRTTHVHTSVLPSVMTIITQSLLKPNFTISPPKRTRDFCTAWEQCPIHRHPKIQAWLHSLPACPCRYPYGLYYNNTVFDKIQRKLFSWRNVNSKLEKLAVFKPTAAYCIRQLLPSSATTPATQQCCYDRRLRLITRGSGSGTPNLVAPELNEGIHNYVDLMPLISCQGDWTRYQAVRPPNNALKCRENPRREEFRRQFKRAREF